MAGGALHTVHKDGAWTNEFEGEGPSGTTYDTQHEAQAAGRHLARERQVEHVVHGPDGQIQESSADGDELQESQG